MAQPARNPVAIKRKAVYLGLIMKMLGRSDLHITPVGFGSWAVGGSWQFGWGKQDDAASIGAIHQALELGVNWIDTAPAYGLGHSEKIVAQALEQWSGDKPYVFTKCGIVWDKDGKVDYSLKAASIRRECEASLKRLKVDAIDLYQAHWSADDLAETLEGWSEMAKLKKEGKVRWIGTSNFSVEELKKCAEIAPVTSLQPPFSLVKPAAKDELLPYCLEHNIGVIVYSPMASGLLTGKMTRERIEGLPQDDWRKKDKEFTEPKLTENLQLAERVKQVAAKHKVSAGEVAIAWTLANEGVTGAIVGARNAKQVEETIGGAELKLTSEDIAALLGK
jgi:aryl-alcohol dehydrogenase-like predicted oxidoreductase